MQPGIEEFTPAFFDASSAAWRANKIPIGEGSFRYKRDAFIVSEPRSEPQSVRRKSARLQHKARVTREKKRLEQ